MTPHLVFFLQLQFLDYIAIGRYHLLCKQNQAKFFISHTWKGDGNVSQVHLEMSKLTTAFESQQVWNTMIIKQIS